MYVMNILLLVHTFLYDSNAAATAAAAAAAVREVF